ncbi:mechanosensitive ion channel [Staphylococcus canis]|uniref:Mechanosensitive ion channel n=1 Tax=Staphylococcus canis TaxID=2724942 RepID=A0ABS0TB36_9STAP|nr:mechanosensitive ion channel [Staphylococcus canis]MBI5975968.1 mechanosensitive ion channel [Staphylococcus canis]
MRGITNTFMDALHTIIGFIPNLISAIILLIVAWIIATIVKKVIVKGLGALGFEDWLRKKGLVDRNRGTSESEGLIKTFGKLAYFLIFLLFLPAIFDALNMKSVSGPIRDMMQSILNFAPRILVAVIILVVGLFIAKMLGTLVKNLLQSLNVSRFNHYVNFGKDKNSIDLPAAIGWVITTIIGLFFFVQALNTVNLTVLNKIGAAIIGYLPLVISAAIILALGLIGGNLLAKFIRKSTGNNTLAEIVKFLLIIVAIFMTLDQLNFAQNIVNVAFLLVLGAVAVAFAIAFGIGGRPFAEQQLQKLTRKMENDNDDVTRR